MSQSTLDVAAGDVRLRPYQEEQVSAVLDAWRDGQRSVIVSSPTGTGKAQPLGEPVLTPAGWRTMGELAMGDEVIAGDGTATQVIGVFPQGRRECVRMVASDGASARCDPEHLWSVAPAWEGNPEGKWRVMPTADLGTRPPSGRRAWRLPLVGPVESPAEDLPLDPYVVGVLVADGLADDPVTFCPGDQHKWVAEKVADLLPPELHLHRRQNGKAHALWRISGKPGRGGNIALDWLRETGLAYRNSWERILPEQVLRGSVDQRVALAEGLWDSDGTMQGDRRGEYSTTSEVLAEDVVALVRGLGGVARVTDRVSTYSYAGRRRDGRRSWRIYVALDFGAWPRRSRTRMVDRIEPAGSAEMVCIAVAHPSQTYVTSGHLVTHNTTMFCDLLRRRPGRSLVLVHRTELRRQAMDRMRMMARERSVGGVQADVDESWADVVVASTPTLVSERRLEEYLSHGHPETVICDELHHYASPTYRKVVQKLLDCGANVLGVSATVRREDKLALASIFESVVWQRSMGEMIAEGWLCPIRGRRVRIAADLSTLRAPKGDYTAADLEEALLDSHAPDRVVEAWQSLAADRRHTLVFAPTVAVAKAISTAYQSAGIEAGWLSGETPKHERARLLERFASGDLPVLCNCMVLTEGIDIPQIDCIVVARPTKSRTLTTQMIGRGARKHPGKEDTLVLDLVGTKGVANSSDLGDPAKEPEVQLGAHCRPTVSPNGTFGLAELANVENPLGEQTMEAMDVLSGATYAWTQRGDYSWRLTIAPGHRVDVTEREDARWTVVEDGPDGRTEQVAPDLAFGQGIAEDLARRAVTASGKAFAAKDAPWRSREPSEKQVQLLRKLKVKEKPTTRGEASEMIDRVMGRG